MSAAIVWAIWGHLLKNRKCLQKHVDTNSPKIDPTIESSTQNYPTQYKVGGRGPTDENLKTQELFTTLTPYHSHTAMLLTIAFSREGNGKVIKKETDKETDKQTHTYR